MSKPSIRSQRGRLDGRVISECGIMLILALLTAVSIGVSVPLFRALLGLAVGLVVIGAVWQVLSKAAKEGRYRLLVLDVDGTLVGADQRISRRAREAIRRAVDLGVEVALCTGRSPGATRAFLDELKLKGPQIFFDGALVGCSSGEDVYLLRPERTALSTLVEVCEAESLPIELYSREKHYVAWRGPESDWHAAIQGVAAEVADLRSVLAKEEIVKAELVGRDEHTKAAIARVGHELGGKLRFSRAQVPGYPEYELVNVVHPAVSKGEALRRLAGHLGVPLSKVIAAGDGRNDVPLLAVAGFSVAMGNAPIEVKEAATAVTEPLEEDGLAHAIEQYVLRDGRG